LLERHLDAMAPCPPSQNRTISMLTRVTHNHQTAKDPQLSTREPPLNQQHASVQFAGIER
jgi:hypothetical protein